MTSWISKGRYLGYLLALLAGALLMILSIKVIGTEGVAAGSLEVLSLIVGTGILVWQALRLVKALRRDVSRYVVLKSEGGSVKVHASAVEEALRHTAKSLSEVHDVRVRLVMDKQTSVPSSADVEARIRDITNVVSVHDALTRVLTERYGQIIPGAPHIDFHLTIKHHFRPPSKPKTKGKKPVVPPEEDETKAIRAPQYPVPSDD
jgi:hypothetical protein